MSEIHDRMAQLFDAGLIRQLEQDGMPMLDDSGNPILDAEGKPKIFRLTAADRKVINDRLRAVGIGGANTGTSDADLEAEAKRRHQSGQLSYNGKPITHPIPPVSTDTSTRTA